MITSESFIDPGALERSLAALSDRVADTILPNALQDAIETTRVLFDASGAGVMMVDESTALCAVAATNRPARLLEERQERIGHGPCVDALTFDRTVVTADVTSDPRWPALASDLSGSGVRAVLGVPIRLSGLPVGSLNVYSDRAGAWTDSQTAALEAYGAVIDGLLLTALRAQANQTLVQQLQRALDNRVVIERAIGALMARDRVDPVTAFNELRQQARSAQRKTADAAAELIAELFVS